MMTPDDVEAMLAAGADLVQLPTGYLYEGPRLLKEICRRLIPKPTEVQPTASETEPMAESAAESTAISQEHAENNEERVD